MALMDCPTAASPARSDAALQVRAPGRLHLGFFDPAGTLGRRFGSLGLVIDGFETVVELADAAQDEVLCDDSTAADPLRAAEATADIARAALWLQRLRSASGVPVALARQPLRLYLRQRLPAHAGFGSGTQLALAVGRAFAARHGLAVGTAELARWLGRGVRSGVGIAGFDQGGLLADGGPGADGRPAPLLSRIAFPVDWRVLVVQDPQLRGLSGQRELQAMATLQPLPQAQAADICHQVLMRVLPGAADADFPLFAEGLTRLQQVLGEHFAPAQAGSAYTSPAVGRLLRWLGQADGAAIGQSSWGPTGFAVLPSAQRADAALAAAREAGVLDPGLTVHTVAARNHGATLA
jgi:beta-RFAP synthase